ncbi:hypothetical protein LTR91_003487 [Friedmanniomyces endolithicus]|uniref:Uncharacterized protein n=1 Tax=Friedmanniomyces endolithicus TaxID=329885 RepID=A0AAN6KXG1_9PEZI|nr:hypothetical protein LTR75_009050 [Friedmanniomyces endolithicus]KAK0800887.1 hypothetical protein LTR38_007053 [Friedmanniomyces endolithicus]KAK0808041.1 hypothetical protein LTR59_003100 [Friedmanniomyces endolithicus]KAK0839388.1 hypothetical protein LTR03_011293 [Friedmanniomyces endolithicus]KAK0916108.1 hypothetical protein LTR02_000998 [Friedmanniomyces endolithicus]
MATPPVSRLAPTLSTLPPELRLQIYEYILVDRNKPRRIMFKHRPHLTCSFAAVKEPPLAFVDRRIRDEALTVFYGGNTFHCPNQSALAYWLLPREVGMNQDLYDARKGVWQVECALGLAGVKLEPGVLRMPAKCQVSGTRIVWWVSCSSFVLVGTMAVDEGMQVVRTIDASSFLKQVVDAQMVPQVDALEAMWRAIAASSRGIREVRRKREGRK